LTAYGYRCTPTGKRWAGGGKDIAAKITELHQRQDIVRMVFAAAPSQHEVLDALVAAREIDWARIDAFHMDEYVDCRPARPSGLRTSSTNISSTK
jgi:glucosamine-6-phosphate deaminase